MMMDKINLVVEGMSCSHCENSIKKSVGALFGVYEVDVYLQEKKVSVEYDASKISVQTIKETIEEHGYDVR